MEGLSISETAERLGVSITTLRRWDADGRIKGFRTPGGHRRFALTEVLRIQDDLTSQAEAGERLTLGYARVSSHDQKDDLARQVDRLATFCTAHGWRHEIIEDLGSGLNDEKKGLRRLLKRICAGEVDRLVLTHKDRLLRFGAELVFALCEQFGTEVVLINAKADTACEEEDLAQDVLEIITVFSARLYGARSHRNQKLLDGVRKAVEESAPC